jgi:hypothetical protein
MTSTTAQRTLRQLIRFEEERESRRRSIFAFSVGPWTPCGLCGEPTKALWCDGGYGGFSEPLHLICDGQALAPSAAPVFARKLLNRHERRRQGLPRPPRRAAVELLLVNPRRP